MKAVAPRRGPVSSTQLPPWNSSWKRAGRLMSVTNSHTTLGAALISVETTTAGAPASRPISAASTPGDPPFRYSGLEDESPVADGESSLAERKTDGCFLLSGLCFGQDATGPVRHLPPQ